VLRKFIFRYKYWIITAFIIFALLTLFLILTSEGPQSGAFKYQIF